MAAHVQFPLREMCVQEGRAQRKWQLDEQTQGIDEVTAGPFLRGSKEARTARGRRKKNGLLLKRNLRSADEVGETQNGSSGQTPRQRTCGNELESDSGKVEPM